MEFIWTDQIDRPADHMTGKNLEPEILMLAATLMLARRPSCCWPASRGCPVLAASTSADGHRHCPAS
jgi:hypothetical protein